MEQINILIQSFFLVLVSETGDKTQLIALLLATKFKKPWIVMAGIFVATILNHALASFAGGWFAGLFEANTLKILLTVVFVVFGFWILIPDNEEEISAHGNGGAFFTTLVVFFLAEMGDKTQLSTVVLGAKFNSVILVTLGTTLGMLVADGAVVFYGQNLLKRISLKLIRYVAFVLFLIFAAAVWI